MFRKLFSAIGRALRAFFGFPFRLLGGIFGAGQAYYDHEDVIPENSEADLVEELADLKRWIADMLAGRSPAPCRGRLAGWCAALDRESIEKVARVALAGRLRDHLSGKQQFQGIPPVLSYDDTREWIKARDVGRWRAAERVDFIQPDLVSPRRVQAPSLQLADLDPLDDQPDTLRPAF
jgi:hypothetical protein